MNRQIAVVAQIELARVVPREVRPGDARALRVFRHIPAADDRGRGAVLRVIRDARRAADHRRLVEVGKRDGHGEGARQRVQVVHLGGPHGHLVGVIAGPGLEVRLGGEAEHAAVADRKEALVVPAEAPGDVGPLGIGCGVAGVREGGALVLGMVDGRGSLDQRRLVHVP